MSHAHPHLRVCPTRGPERTAAHIKILRNQSVQHLDSVSETLGHLFKVVLIKTSKGLFRELSDGRAGHLPTKLSTTHLVEELSFYS